MAGQENKYRFGPYELRTRTRELYKFDVKLKLRSQAFHVLNVLVERRGDVVTREELRQLLWPEETFVDFEHGLNGTISELRGVLNDTATDPKFIETLPKLGYRLIVSVSEAPSPSNANSLPAAISETSKVLSKPIVGQGWRIALLLAALVLPAGLSWRYLSHPSRALALKETDTIVLADFQNTTGEQVFDEALKQGLTVAFEQSPYFHVLPDRKAVLILKQMGRSPDERVTGQTAIDLCLRAGSKAMVQGSITSLGASYLIGLTAVRCDNSDAIAHAQAQARRKEDIIRALGTASIRLRGLLGESMASLEEHNAALEQVTTSSLEALKAYGTANSTFSRQGERPAIPLFQRAIDLDPGFAMAYGQLASIYRNLGETEQASQNATKAFQFKERLTESERLVIESWYNIFATGDLEKAARLFEMELQNYPATPGVLNDLGSVYANLGRYEKAIPIYRQALNMDPNVEATYYNLAASLLATEQSDEARTVLWEADHHELQTSSLLQARYWEAFHEGNRKEMRELLSQATGMPGARSLLLSEQARTEAYFGRFGQARKLSELAANLMSQDGEKESAAACMAEVAVREVEVGDASRARRTALHSLQLARNQGVVTLASLVMAQIGDFKLAQTLVEELNQKYPSDTLIQKYWLPTIRARMELKQKNWAKGLETLSVAEPFDFAATPALATSTLYPAYVRGEIYAAAGNEKQAVAEFSKLIAHPGMVLNFPLGALARLRSAQAYAVLGNSAKARESYQEFFELWKEADSGLPILKQAKAEYAKLQ